MTFNAESLQATLASLADGQPPTRYLVAFSGGLDSSVLLHALAQLSEVPLLALHVDHRLHEDSCRWAEHCRDFAQQLAVEYQQFVVEIDRDSGDSLEAAARDARYRVLGEQLQPGDSLLSAHHQDDQAETLMLNLLRGSGAAGLAGIGSVQPLGPGLLVRPLLEVSREELQAYAARHQLRWLEDPSNLDTQFDRNFLRREVMPLLQGRWPATTAQLAHSAVLAGEAAGMLEQLADADLVVLGSPDRLEVAGLLALGDARARNVLRRAIQRLRLPSAPKRRLRQISQELLSAKADAEPMVCWPGAEVRRYREWLYILPAALASNSDRPAHLSVAYPAADLGDLGTLRLVTGNSPGIRRDLLEAGLELRFRRGGEALRPLGRGQTHKLKKLLQEAGVVPWMRGRIPLLFVGEQLVAVADIWLDDGCVEDLGYTVEWLGRPPLS